MFHGFFLMVMIYETWIDINSSFSSNDKKIFQRMHKQHQIVFVIIIMGANIF